MKNRTKLIIEELVLFGTIILLIDVLPILINTLRG